MGHWRPSAISLGITEIVLIAQNAVQLLKAFGSATDDVLNTGGEITGAGRGSPYSSPKGPNLVQVHVKAPPFPRPLPQAREEHFRPCGLHTSFGNERHPTILTLPPFHLSETKLQLLRRRKYCSAILLFLFQTLLLPDPSDQAEERKRH
ncbi:uncharacterized protein CLUP02_08891 [Colletotrichum lupini]|uniref:Uncharacterized protein n=1 Tax=Colletotrichum lupini TaxID=145971 RepID=A0A9Q8SV48_9PEZI|nr:uncharacterized protein CLUP02_08891 [Colletotrichum lupini]UQC83396.1 hypothetical protein CLUP02_08891 [Colletotrichum lupini]